MINYPLFINIHLNTIKFSILYFTLILVAVLHFIIATQNYITHDGSALLYYPHAQFGYHYHLNVSY